ncbi:hypothetical protein BJ878DRAFT_556693 [Calycina marina]|uniref:RRM domain-containing protein n=1 Tax=Calycina marina TaxID=1763456 RepID=A0A9P7YZF0_9HELO|nr:hypothetical protein BJ878DRAFT_556693 [Calycina marina]
MEKAAPVLQTVYSLGFTEAWAQHYYVTNECLSPRSHVPGIPPRYELEAREGRALYIRGIPPQAKSQFVTGLFRRFAPVMYDVCVMDNTSHEIFRWIITRSSDAVVQLLGILAGNVIKWNEYGMGEPRMIYVCPTWRPGTTFVATADFTVESLLEQLWLSRAPPEEDNYLYGHFLENSEYTKEEIPRLAGRLQVYGVHEDMFEEGTSDNENDDVDDAGESPLAQAVAPPTHRAFEVEPVLPATPATTVATPATTWAKITGAVVDKKMINIKHENKAVGPAPRILAAGHATTIGRTEPADQQMRTVLLLNLPPNTTITNISDAISEGSLVAIILAFDLETGDRYAGVTFQYASDAMDFHGVLLAEKSTRTPERFKFVVDSAINEFPVPINETIVAMGPPTYATRRLTVVKKAFFFTMKETQLMSFCEKRGIASEDIQKIWLYNGGNATIIMAKVEDAIKLKDALENQRDTALSNSPWVDLQVTYSKDPCALAEPLYFYSDLQ